MSLQLVSGALKARQTRACSVCIEQYCADTPETYALFDDHGMIWLDDLDAGSAVGD